MRKHAPVALAFVLAVALGCKKEEAAPPPPPPAPTAPAPAPAAAPAAAPAPAAGVARVVVNNQGTITVNGKAMTLDQVKTLLASGDKPTSIEYMREDRDHDPTPEAAPVVHGLLSAIMDSKIPVRMAR